MRMLPLFVSRSMVGPPDPTVPSRLCLDAVPPFTSRSKSLVTLEFEVWARMFALMLEGRWTVIDAFEVFARTELSRRLARVRSIEPLEVSTFTGALGRGSVMRALILPFEV